MTEFDTRTTLILINTIILAESVDNMQITLNEFKSYCLDVYIDKTKVFFFQMDQCVKEVFVFTDVKLKTIRFKKQ